MKRLIEDRVLRVRHLLALRGSADEPLAVTSEGDDGRGGAPALGVRDDGRLGSFEHGHTGVGRAQVDPDRLCHICPSLLPVVLI
jgi:NAD-specific glutamate dehydrogenase